MQEEKSISVDNSNDPQLYANCPGEKSVEKEINLNLLFPNEETDLNELFPERDMKSLLKQICKNRNDIKKITTQFKSKQSDY